MDVPGEVQVEQLHGDDLGVTSPCGAALDAKGRALAGLAHAGNDAAAEMGAERLAQADGGSRLALAEGGGRDASDHDLGEWEGWREGGERVVGGTLEGTGGGTPARARRAPALAAKRQSHHIFR